MGVSPCLVVALFALQSLVGCWRYFTVYSARLHIALAVQLAYNDGDSNLIIIFDLKKCYAEQLLHCTLMCWPGKVKVYAQGQNEFIFSESTITARIRFQSENTLVEKRFRRRCIRTEHLSMFYLCPRSHSRRGHLKKKSSRLNLTRFLRSWRITIICPGIILLQRKSF